MDSLKTSGLARLVTCILGASMLTAAGITVVGLRTSEVHAGYALHALMQKKARLVQERSKLNLEIAALIRPERLQRLAKTLDLVPPRAERVLMMDALPIDVDAVDFKRQGQPSKTETP